MLIPGFLISLVTFPGVMVHELAHLVFCKLTNTPVYLGALGSIFWLDAIYGAGGCPGYS